MRIAVMANSDVDGDAPSDLPARGQLVSERSAGCGVGAAGAADPAGAAWRTTAQDRHAGVWEAIWAELHMALRERMGREATPSAAVLDRQSVKSAEKGAVKTTRWVNDGLGAQEDEGPQTPRPGRQRRAADAGRRPFGGDPGPRRGRSRTRQDTSTVP